VIGTRCFEAKCYPQCHKSKCPKESLGISTFVLGHFVYADTILLRDVGTGLPVLQHHNPDERDTQYYLFALVSVPNFDR